VASFGIGEVEELLALPASTLRHWERVIPLLAPRKDAFGRRVYSEADVRLLFRLKHLTLRKGLGLHAAAEALVSEVAVERPEHRAALAAIRGELIALWLSRHRGLSHGASGHVSMPRVAPSASAASAASRALSRNAAALEARRRNEAPRGAASRRAAAGSAAADFPEKTFGS